MITKDEMSWYLDKFSLLVSTGGVWRTVRRMCIFILGLKGYFEFIGLSTPPLLWKAILIRGYYKRNLMPRILVF